MALELEDLWAEREPRGDDPEREPDDGMSL